MSSITYGTPIQTPIDLSGLGEIWETAISGDNQTIVFASLSYLYFCKYNSTTQSWSPPINFGSQSTGWGYVGMCMTEDGLRVMVSAYFTHVSVYVWNGTTYANQVNVPGPERNWCGIACTPDGTTLVGGEQFGYNYYTKWNPTTNNYNIWTQIPMMNVNTQYIAISSDASRIVYSGGENSPGPIYYSNWDSVANNYGPSILLTANTDGVWSGFSFTRDGIIVMMISINSYANYSIFNKITNTFGPLVQFPIFGARSLWLSYDNTMIYYEKDGVTYQMSVEYKLPESVLYLGDDLIINGSNIEFNNAIVSVNAPISALHVANKAYVDSMINTTLTSQINTQTATRLAEDMILMTQITDIQLMKTDLSIQLNNLYQYFLNQNRDGPVPTRE